MAELQIAVIDVKPGAALESQSGLQMLRPRIFGAFMAPAGPKKVAAIVMHPTSNFMGHYLIRPLAARGICCTVADARFAKPLDRDLILQLARHHEALITIEEGAVGGFGSHVAQLLADEGVFDRGLKFRSMVLPDTFIDQASPEAMYAISGMNAPQIEAKVLQVLGVEVLGRRA